MARLRVVSKASLYAKSFVKKIPSNHGREEIFMLQESLHSTMTAFLKRSSPERRATVHCR